jgi:hypothetical protein
MHGTTIKKKNYRISIKSSIVEVPILAVSYEWDTLTGCRKHGKENIQNMNLQIKVRYIRYTFFSTMATKSEEREVTKW